MFHLLVAFQGWPEGVGSIPTGRIYIKPEEGPGSAFLTNGKLDSAKIARIPALLVTETGGSGPQIARVAQISAVTQGKRDTSIQYVVDGRILPISNDDLERYSGELGIGKYTLTHTHWAVHEADLYKALLLHQQKRAFLPKVFTIEQIHRPAADLVSVMMPFSAEFDAVYEALQEAATAAGLRCQRADDIWEHHTVIQDIVSLIAKARVVICDCSGKNPNVFYEIGIAHSLGKEVLLITQSPEDVPFDLRHLRYVRYLGNSEGLEDLSSAVRSRLESVIGQGG